MSKYRKRCENGLSF